jgi:hemoglobin
MAMNAFESGKISPPLPGAASASYKSTQVFDENTLPQKLRNAHSTKAGAWGIIRVLEGQLRYVIEDTGIASILTPERPGLVLPEQLHHVEPIGAMKMRVEFYDHRPAWPMSFDRSTT